jgi:cytochrome c-type biogenesis protein CcmH
MNASIDTLKNQLAQLKQLHESGALPAAEYESSKAALERRVLDQVLADSDAAPVAPPAGSPPSGPGAGAAVQLAAVAGTQAGVPVGAKSAAKGNAKGNAKNSVNGSVVPTSVAAKLPRGLLAGVASFVVVVALGGYAWTGSPSLAGLGAPPPVPAAATGHAGGDGPQGVSMEQVSEMATRLATRLKDQPQDPQGWAMLGRTYAVLGRNDEAVKAYESAIQQHGDDAVLIADYADALAVKNNRTLAGEPMKWVRRALELDPKNVKALALAGTDAFDRKDFAGAVRYWEELLKVAPAEGNFIQQVQASVAEARQLGGLPSVNTAPAGAPKGGAAPGAVGANTVAAAGPANAAVPANSQAAAPGAAANATVSGTVSLSPSLAAQAGPDDVVFIFARAAEGSRMPLAVLRKRVRDLPASFTLDDSLAMSPAAKLSGAPRVIVGARVSKSGNATPSPGDLTGQVGPVSLGSGALVVEIREQVKP